MAAKHFSLFLLLTLLSSIETHARDSQMFNKVPSKVNDNVVVVEDHQTTHNLQTKQEPLNTKEQEQRQQPPNFIPENENSYGLYGHESGQLPPSTTTTTPTPKNEPFKAFDNNNQFPYNAKYLPKNYNTVAYVTQPEDFSDSSSFEDNNINTNNNNNNYYNGAKNYYHGQQESLKNAEFVNREFTTTTDNNNNNNYYDNNGGNYYNPQDHGIGHETRFMDTAYTTTPNNINNNNNNYYNGGRVNRIQPQGMSDTRFLENGKYFYDINAEKHSRDPFDNAKEFALRNRQYSPQGYYDNNYNNNYNNHNSYDNQYNNYVQGQEQYQDEEDMP